MPRNDRRYPSDLTAREWALLEPLLASSEARGRPPKWPAKRVADAVFYLLRSGCAWRMLPREFPPWHTVYYHFSGSGVGTDGSGGPTTGCARRYVKPKGVRRTPPQRGGDRQPGGERGRSGRTGARLRWSEAAFRQQTPPARGHRRARTRRARVCAASLHERDGAQGLLTYELKEELPQLELLWADGAYTRGFREWAQKERGGWRVEVAHHRDRQLWRYGL